VPAHRRRARVPLKLRERGLVTEKDRAIVISTANGLKFTEFKLAYHERRIAGVSAGRANSPIVMSPDVERVAAAIEAM